MYVRKCVNYCIILRTSNFRGIPHRKGPEIDLSGGEFFSKFTHIIFFERERETDPSY